MNFSTFYFANLVKGGGGKYKEEDIKPYSYYRKPIDYSKQPFPRGRSRIHADADNNVKEYVARKIVDTTIKTGGTLADAAFFLAVAQCESGFNPDAAAGTTSALGIGQITDATWDTMENWRFNSVDPKINPLDFNKNKETKFSLYNKTRLDADANIRALIELLYFIDLKCVMPLITEGI
ncbi:MAG: phage tail tip lysozyme, partial [Fibrobacterota bacterium]